MSTIQIGHDEPLGAGVPTIVGVHEGTVVTFSDLPGLVLSVTGGVLTIHGTGSTAPVIKPVAGNEIKVKPTPLFGDF